MRAPYAKCSIFARMASALLIVVLPSTLTASVANPDGLTFSSTPTEWTDKLPDLTPPLRVAAWAREQLAKLEELAGRLQLTLRRPRLENRRYPRSISPRIPKRFSPALFSAWAVYCGRATCAPNTCRPTVYARC
jgi:hypothetical protein